MELSDEEIRLWHAWKRASESVRGLVAQDLTDRAGLSDPDYAILSRVADAGGAVRQNELGSALAWHRSRLSHQLTRMEERGLVSRRPIDAGVEVLLTADGQKAIASARPVHAESVRKHLTGVLPQRQADALRHALESIVEAANSDP